MITHLSLFDLQCNAVACANLSSILLQKSILPEASKANQFSIHLLHSVSTSLNIATLQLTAYNELSLNHLKFMLLPCAYTIAVSGLASLAQRTGYLSSQLDNIYQTTPKIMHIANCLFSSASIFILSKSQSISHPFISAQIFYSLNLSEIVLNCL